MRLKKVNHENLQMWVRPGTSDEKTFNEVIVNHTYAYKDFYVEHGEIWFDFGGNVGAFALWALWKGAKHVVIYEPDPLSCIMIEKNLALNGLSDHATLIKKAVVKKGAPKVLKLFIGHNGNVWRNSLIKNWNGKYVRVDTVTFDEVFEKYNKELLCVKMDIEGAEMDILEETDAVFKKMVFEWSFDIDTRVNRFKKCVQRLAPKYSQCYEKGSFLKMDHEIVPEFIFPKASNIYLINY